MKVVVLYNNGLNSIAVDAPEDITLIEFKEQVTVEGWIISGLEFIEE